MDYQRETVNCPCCGSANYETYIENAKEFYNNLPEFFNVVRCSDCDFIFTNPRPTKETISFFYPDTAGYYQPVERNKPTTHSFRKNLSNAVLKHCFNYQLQTSCGPAVAHFLKLLMAKRIALMHIPPFVPGGRLLDIGCAWGNYLAQMRDLNWDVYGTEINEKAVKYASEELHLKNVRHGFFEDVAWETEFFDVVNMHMVLEHLHQPLQSLKIVNSVMKPKATLMLSVPDISGFEARIYKDKAYTLHVPQHLNHFSPKTVTSFLNKAGFTIEKIIHHRFDRDLVASAQYLDNKLPAKLLHNKIVRKTVVRATVWLLAALGKTSRMSVYANKSNA